MKNYNFSINAAVIFAVFLIRIPNGYSEDQFMQPQHLQNTPETSVEASVSEEPAPVEVQMPSLQKMDADALIPVQPQNLVPSEEGAVTIKKTILPIMENNLAESVKVESIGTENESAEQKISQPDFPAESAIKPKYEVITLPTDDGPDFDAAPGLPVKEIEGLEYEQEIEITDEDGKVKGSGKVIAAYIDLEKQEIFYGIQMDNGVTTITDGKGREMTDVPPVPDKIYDTPLGNIFKTGSRNKITFSVAKKFKVYFFQRPNVIGIYTEFEQIPPPLLPKTA